MSQLRPYQESIIEDARSAMRQGLRRLLIVAPTGAGKTLLTAHILKSAASRAMRAWFLVHRVELVAQSRVAFDQEQINYGVIAPGFPELREEVIQIGSLQSVARRIARYPEPQLIIWDEAHHVAARTWERLYQLFPKAFHIGLSATPERLDGAGLARFFDRIIIGPEVVELIRQGFLSPYRIFAPFGQGFAPDFNGVRKQFGDFRTAEIETQCSRPTIIGNLVHEYLKHARDKQAIVFAITCEHSRAIARHFKEAGIVCEHVDGETPRWERADIVERFRQRKLNVMTNVELFGEGFDVPSLDCVILARPTLSFALYRQQIGRALRPYPGKLHAIILDHVGNVMRHGLPDDPVDWGLHDGKARHKTSAPRVCPQCFFANRAGAGVCEHCTFAWPIEEREILESPGELSELEQARVKRNARREVGRARSLQELITIGKSRGYKPGWAFQVFQARQRRG